jgi:hypothetical protein
MQTTFNRCYNTIFFSCEIVLHVRIIKQKGMNACMCVIFQSNGALVGPWTPWPVAYSNHRHLGPWISGTVGSLARGQRGP